MGNGFIVVHHLEEVGKSILAYPR